MEIRLHFNNFWSEFNKNDNVFIWVLKQKHNVSLDDVNPNLVISNIGNPNDLGKSRPFSNTFTIFFNGGEPYLPFPDIKIADHFLGGFDLHYPNYTRFPGYYLYIYQYIKKGLITDLSIFKQSNRIIPSKKKFCSLVCGHLNGNRGRFFEKLNKYKKVETNAPPYKDFVIPFDNTSFTSTLPKINFIKDYKFNLAFENNFRGSYPSYPGANIVNGELISMSGMVSEKFIEPIIAGVLPIYWGDENIKNNFNPNSFLDRNDFNNDEDLIEKIIELDNNDDLYQSYFKEPIITELQTDIVNLDYLVSIFEPIIDCIK